MDEADTVIWGCYRIHREAERIAQQTGYPVLTIDNLIRLGALDPTWEPA